MLEAQPAIPMHDQYSLAHARRCRSSPTGAAPVRRADTAGRRIDYMLLCRVLGFDTPQGVVG
jgi:hypothetical protein